MHKMLSKPWKWLNSTPAKAGLLLGVFLSVLALAQLETLHHAVHADAGETTHECAVTLLATGKVFLTEGSVTVIVAELPSTAEVRQDSVLSTAAFGLLPPGRAPPTLHS